MKNKIKNKIDNEILEIARNSLRQAITNNTNLSRATLIVGMAGLNQIQDSADMVMW